MTDRFPTGIRRRLALTFIVVAGVAAGALGIGAAAVSTSYRHRSFLDRSLEQVEREVARLERSQAPALEGSGEPGGPDIVIVGGTIESSVATLDITDVSQRLRNQLREDPGEVRHDTVEVGGESFLVIGVHSNELRADVYFFFPRGDVVRGLQELRVTLAVAGSPSSPGPPSSARWLPDAPCALCAKRPMRLAR